MMKIRELELFDLYGDGTLVMRTRMEEDQGDLWYAWHIVARHMMIDKIAYQKRPVAVWRVPCFGTWTVKAFVLDRATKEKLQESANFVSDWRSSPGLGDIHLFLQGPPTVERISGPFHKMYVDQELPENSQYAWYVYRTDEPDPVIKRLYQDAPEYVCAIHEPGEYFVKVFVLADGKKDSMKSEIFMVE